MTYDLVIEMISLTILCILLFWISIDIMPQIKKKNFSVCIILTLLVVLAETGCLFTDNTGGMKRWWSMFFNAAGFAAAPFVPLVEAQMYVEKGKKLRWTSIPAVVNAVLALLSPLRGWIFRVTEENRYERGAWFEVYLCVFAFSMLYSLYVKLRSARKFPAFISWKILVCNAFVCLGFLSQVIFPEYRTTWLAMAVYYSMFYGILKEKNGMLDEMTGLLNRNTFNLLLDSYVTTENDHVTVVTLDVNDFKKINDTKGHQCGDLYLCRTADLIRSVFGNRNKVFRIGGDEFAVLLERSTEREIKRYFRRLDAGVDRARELDWDFPTLAYGYAVHEAGAEISQTIALADSRMYEKKAAQKKKNMIFYIRKNAEALACESVGCVLGLSLRNSGSGQRKRNRR